MRLSDCSFIVVDCETTGYHPSAHHRIVELALLPLDADGTPGELWCTLLRPDRDLGPTEVHGIRGRDLQDAPTFAEVAGEVIDRLAGRVVVAHNARFDCVFLQAELARAGLPIPPLPAVCTLRLAHLAGHRGRARLSDCCSRLGIRQEEAHTAEDDVLACAAVFEALAAELTARGATTLADLDCDPPLPRSAWPASSARAAPVRRRSAGSAGRPEPSFLASLTQEADLPHGPDATAVAAYLDVLDRALEDRRLTSDEQADLGAVASMVGLSAARVRAVHTDYVATLVAIAYRDRVITDRERHDLELVAEALGVGELEDMLARLASGEAAGVAGSSDTAGGIAGQSVCFTGALTCRYDGELITRDLAQHLAEQAGLLVRPSVTKKLDLLVVADPHSMSSKARKAQQYGTRIVAETAFWPMLGIEVE